MWSAGKNEKCILGNFFTEGWKRVGGSVITMVMTCAKIVFLLGLSYNFIMSDFAYDLHIGFLLIDS